MADTTRNFIIGLVSIVGLIGFAALLMFFGELNLLPRQQYVININMNVAGGLRAGSPVELNGVFIGTVTKVDLHPYPPDPSYPVRVIANINKYHQIPTPVDARVERSLLAGTAVLQLISTPPRTDEPPLHLATDGTANLFVTERPLLDEIRAELDERTKPLVEAMESFNRLSSTYIALGENLSDMFRPIDAELDDSETPNIQHIMTKFDGMLEEARQALRLASRWLDDDQLNVDARQAVANVRELTLQATTTIEQYGKLAEKLHSDTDEILKAILPVAEEMALTLEEVRSLIRSAGEGRGTIAQLLNNPDLYNSLNDAAERLEQALTDVRLFIQKIRTEGLPTRIW